jgi:hypothetical protein
VYTTWEGGGGKGNKGGRLPHKRSTHDSFFFSTNTFQQTRLGFERFIVYPRMRWVGSAGWYLGRNGLFCLRVATVLHTTYTSHHPPHPPHYLSTSPRIDSTLCFFLLSLKMAPLWKSSLLHPNSILHNLPLTSDVWFLHPCKSVTSDDDAISEGRK